LGVFLKESPGQTVVGFRKNRNTGKIQHYSNSMPADCISQYRYPHQMTVIAARFLKAAALLWTNLMYIFFCKYLRK